MFRILNRGKGSAEDAPRTNGHDLTEGPLPPWSDDPQVRETRVFVGKRKSKDQLPARVLTLAGLIITAALIGSAFVGYEAQRLFAVANNHDPALKATAADEVRAIIIAALPDLGWVGMALVALVAALRGQSSLRARIGVIVFFALSLGAQVLYAPPTAGGILVAVIAPLTMAWMLETWIVEVRRWAAARRNLEMTETPILNEVLFFLLRFIRGLVGLLLWVVRLAFDRRGTWQGVQAWVLDTAPLAPGRTLASQRAEQALQLAEGATLTAEQVREQAAADRLALETKALDDHQAAEQLLAEVREETARRIDEVEQAAAQQVAHAHELAEEQVRIIREWSTREAQAQSDQLQQVREDLVRVTAERDRALVGAQRVQQVEAQYREAQSQLGAARHAFGLLSQYAGARAVLRARYEGLRLSDPARYGDRVLMPEYAQAWAPDAGVTEQTARRYLTEHLNDPAAGTGQEGE